MVNATLETPTRRRDPARPARPVLRYHGGKFLQSKQIIALFPPHRIYTEAFCGAASVLMQKPRCYSEIINDLDDEVVNLFRVLRSEAQAALQERGLRLTPYSRTEFKLAYQPAPVEDSVERARRLVIRSFMGFGSAATNAAHLTGFRSNSVRSGTTPAQDWANYPNCLKAFTQRLNGVLVECLPATRVLRLHDAPDCLHFVDPPYVHETRRGMTDNRKNAAYRHEMTDEQHVELAAVLRSLSGMVVLCGYRSTLYDTLYPDWLRIDRTALADGARKRTESLWLNPKAAAHSQRSLEL